MLEKTHQQAGQGSKPSGLPKIDQAVRCSMKEGMNLAYSCTVTVQPFLEDRCYPLGKVPMPLVPLHLPMELLVWMKDPVPLLKKKF